MHSAIRESISCSIRDVIDNGSIIRSVKRESTVPGGSWNAFIAAIQKKVPGRVEDSARYRGASVGPERVVLWPREGRILHADRGSFLNSRVLDRVVGSVFDEVPGEFLGDDSQERILEGRSAVAGVDR